MEDDDDETMMDKERGIRVVGLHGCNVYLKEENRGWNDVGHLALVPCMNADT